MIQNVFSLYYYQSFGLNRVFYARYLTDLGGGEIDPLFDRSQGGR